MNRRTIGLMATLVLGLLVAPLATEAQQPPEVRWVGYLQAGINGLPGGFEAVLCEGLRDLGYVEGRNLRLESRVGTSRA
jgi:hypothetical protein